MTGALSDGSLRSFFDGSPDALFIADERGAILYSNEALARLLAAPPSEGATLADILVPEDRSRVSEALARVAAGEGPLDLACLVRAPEGSDAAVVCALRRAPERAEIHGALRPSGAALSGEGRDGPVAQAKLREEIFQVVLEELPISAWAIHRDGTYIYHDGRGIDEAGLKRGSLVGQNVYDLYEYSKEEGSPVKRAFAGERLYIENEDDGTIWEHWFWPVRDGSGAVVRVVGASLNVTAARRAERELRSKLELIETQRQVIKELAAPIIEVWEGVLAVPMVGVFDSVRAAEVTTNLLTEVNRRRARFVLLDLTGVEVLDTGTAAHLLSMVRALRLLGAEGILTGIRPVIAQTMVSLGIELADMTTVAGLREGILYCMRRSQEGHS